MLPLYIAYQWEWYQQTFHGFPGVSDSGKPCYGGSGRKSPCIIPFGNGLWMTPVRPSPPPPPPPPSDHLESFHSHLNSIEPSIDFTYELEEQEKLPFLDLLIKHHPDGTLSTTVYRKKTHTDDFQSHLWPI